MLTVRYTESGVSSLRYGNTELLADGNLSVRKAILAGPAGSREASVTPTRTILLPNLRAIRRVYPWGTIGCTYAVTHGNRLELTVSVQNASSDTLSGLWIQLLEIRFPAAPRGWVKDYAYLGANLGSPTVNVADYGSGALAVCNDDVERPLLVGFPGRASLVERPVWVCSSNIGWLSPLLDPYLERPIAPHGSDTYHVSLRFARASARETDLAGDLYRGLARAHPFQLDWKNRRPIGALHLSTSEAPYHSAANPRGWFSDPKHVEVRTPAGREAFRRRLMAYADAGIAELKRMNAQGMVVWDVEGQQYPHATSYIGDPRLLGTLAPEMDAAADELFRRFRAAGFRVGVCVRPQHLVRSASHAAARQQEPSDAKEAVATLIDKIAYACKRWGCTLFYVDSNGDPNVPYAPDVFEKVTDALRQRGLAALLMPEHKSTRYYARTAPYAGLRNGAIGTPEGVRAAYPGAFGVLYVPDGPLAQKRRELVDAVRRGDILMFRAWFDDPVNAEVRSIYRDAGK